MNAPPPTEPVRPRLIDPSRRWIHKLRVQLTDACNFRCFYCMPENAKFLPEKLLLPTDVLVETVRQLVSHGIDEVRVTGGEPTLRRDFVPIMEALSTLPLSKLGLTTNGFLLERFLPALSRTRLQHINISLDSLDPANFHRITHTDTFERVLRAIRATRDAGFTVKLNCILFRGLNDHEVPAFIDFSVREGIEVRFLEYMRIGSTYGDNEDRFIPAAEVIKRLRDNGHQLTPVVMPKDSTSFNYQTGTGARIGFIASESQPFCGNCSRLRLSATGMLRACLMSTKGLPIRNVPKEKIRDVIHDVMAMKPTGRLYEIKQDMHAIGG
jgi:cyclic pyranopterin phosphate synthase